MQNKTILRHENSWVKGQTLLSTEKKTVDDADVIFIILLLCYSSTVLITESSSLTHSERMHSWKVCARVLFFYFDIQIPSFIASVKSVKVFTMCVSLWGGNGLLVCIQSQSPSEAFVSDFL